MTRQAHPSAPSPKTSCSTWSISWRKSPQATPTTTSTAKPSTCSRRTAPIRIWSRCCVQRSASATKWRSAGNGGSGSRVPMDYPLTRKDAVVDDYFGTPVADPYRWLEDPNSAETRAWVEAQNAITRAFLERLPARDRIHSRLTELWDYARYGVPSRRPLVRLRQERWPAEPGRDLQSRRARCSTGGAHRPQPPVLGRHRGTRNLVLQPRWAVPRIQRVGRGLGGSTGVCATSPPRRICRT